MDKYTEPGNPDQMGYPDEPLEESDIIGWYAYLDADLQWIESQPESKGAVFNNYNMPACENGDIACGNKYYTCKRCRK